MNFKVGDVIRLRGAAINSLIESIRYNEASKAVIFMDVRHEDRPGLFCIPSREIEGAELVHRRLEPGRTIMGIDPKKIAGKYSDVLVKKYFMSDLENDPKFLNDMEILKGIIVDHLKEALCTGFSQGGLVPEKEAEISPRLDTLSIRDQMWIKLNTGNSPNVLDQEDFNKALAEKKELTTLESNLIATLIERLGWGI